MNYTALFKQAKHAAKLANKPSIIIFFDMIWCGFTYSAGYADYVLFEFYKLPAAKRATYITRGVSNQIVKKLNTDLDAWNIFDDKTRFNTYFSSYIGRGWLNLQKASKEDFIDFMNDYTAIIIKPIDAICGAGIEKLNKNDFTSLETMYDYILASGSLLVEEVICQHPDIAKLYNRSVNTIRVVSLYANNEVHIPFTCIRIGNNAVVDNINAGGMAALIDISTGKISKPAADKDGIIHTHHPVSNTSLLGYQIPLWEECMETVRKAASKIPQIGYVGWDIAITKDGPLLIEGNQFPGHDIIQMPIHLKDGIGMLPTYRKYINI